MAFYSVSDRRGESICADSRHCFWSSGLGSHRDPPRWSDHRGDCIVRGLLLHLSGSPILSGIASQFFTSPLSSLTEVRSVGLWGLPSQANVVQGLLHPAHHIPTCKVHSRFPGAPYHVTNLIHIHIDLLTILTSQSLPGRHLPAPSIAKKSSLRPYHIVSLLRGAIRSDALFKVDKH